MPEGIPKGVERRSSCDFQLDQESPREVLPTLLRRWRLIALVVVLVMTLAAMALLVLPPRYTSEMMFLFEDKQNPLKTDNQTMMQEQAQAVAIVGEIQVLRSRDLARRVIDELRLESDPEFAGTEAQDEGAFGAAWSALKQTLVAPDRSGERIIETYLAGLRVSQITGSPVVLVRFTSNQAEKSAKILNAIAQAYAVSRLEDRTKTAEWVSKWLAEHIQSMREKVEAAERDLAAYRTAHRLISGEKAALINERISKVNIELADAMATRQTLEARLQQAKRTPKSPDSASAFSKVIDSELIQQLRQRQVELEQRIAERGQTLGIRHPQMIQLQAERTKLASELQSEISRLANKLEFETQVAQAREQGLIQQLEAAKQEFSSADRASVGLRALEREVDSNRIMLERFIKLAPEMSAQTDVQALLPNARVISAPDVRHDPSFPQPIPILAISLLAAIGLGVLLALYADHLDQRTFVSAEEVEAATRLPVLALIPRVRGAWRSVSKALESGHPVFAEAISALFTRLVMTHRAHTDVLSHRQEIKSIALISCEPREGKSTIALALARHQARCGRRVILIDADFAKSRLAAATGVRADSPGLAEVLLGKAAIDDVVKHDSQSPLAMILPGRAPIDHSALATSSAVETTIAWLRETYDMVVIDTQPVMATAHAYQFAGAADISLMVVRWGRTQRREVLYVLSQLRLLGCNVNAAILSMVDFGKSRRYGYGDSHYYSGRDQQYYANVAAGS